MAALGRFLVVFAAAIAAAASIGKLVPHVPGLAAEFGIALGTAGFLVSAVMLPGALAGPLFGAAADRSPARRLVMLGLALQAAASALAPFASTLHAIVALRLVEGAGYSLVIVSGTLLVVAVSAARHQALALATFSAFAPLGFALGQLFAARAGWLGIGFGHAAALAVMAALVLWTLPPGTRPGPPRQRAPLFNALRHAPALRTAAAFGCVAGLLLGAVALAPLALAAAAGISIAAAAQLAALAALAGIAGRFASGWLLGRHAPWRVLAVAAALGIACLPAALAAAAPLGMALIAYAAFQIAMGALAGILSAMLPRVAPSGGELGAVTGLTNQLVTLGNLFGPPLTLAVYGAGGAWASVALLMGIAAAAALLVRTVPAYARSP